MRRECWCQQAEHRFFSATKLSFFSPVNEYCTTLTYLERPPLKAAFTSRMVSSALPRRIAAADSFQANLIFVRFLLIIREVFALNNFFFIFNKNLRFVAIKHFITKRIVLGSRSGEQVKITIRLIAVETDESRWINH